MFHLVYKFGTITTNYLLYYYQGKQPIVSFYSEVKLILSLIYE